MILTLLLALGRIFDTFMALLRRIFGTDPPVGPFGRIVGTLSWKSSIVSLVPSSIFPSQHLAHGDDLQGHPREAFGSLMHYMMFLDKY